MSLSVHPTCRRALRLNREAGFGLLVLLTIITGWVMALGSGSALLLKDVYQTWALEQEEGLKIYLPADVTDGTVDSLKNQMGVVQGVKRVVRLDENAVAAALAPFVADPHALPLPVVLDVEVGPDADRPALNRLVLENVATAEIDESKPMLAMMAKVVRGTQLLVLSVAAAMMGIMALLMVLTVRASLRAHRDAVRLLVQLGALDGTVVAMVVRYVGLRLLGGWVLASGFSAAMLAGSLVLWPSLQGVIGWQVWLAVGVAPGLLVAVALLAAAMTARRMLERSHG